MNKVPCMQDSATKNCCRKILIWWFEQYVIR